MNSYARGYAERKQKEREELTAAQEAKAVAIATKDRYETGDSNTPSNAQLQSWGITRDQYRSLYNRAEQDFYAANGKKKGNPTNEINAFLKKQMVDSNGAYGNPLLNPSSDIQDISRSSTAGSGGGGGGGYSAGSYKAPVEELKYYTGDELAKRFGIVNDYATILKELQDATNAQFDETETTMKRAESSNLRSQETAYNQYLQDLRSRSANAVASGATKGTMAANALASLMASQEANREGINTLNDLLYDTAQQRGTSLKADVTTARQQADAIGQYLGNLSTSMDTNAINKYAAELAANAQTRAASIQAGATTNAAKTAADSTYQQILNTFTNDYLNKGYDKKAANAMAYTDYANLVRKQYSTN